MRAEVTEALRVLRESGPTSLTAEIDLLEVEARRAVQLEALAEQGTHTAKAAVGTLRDLLGTVQLQTAALRAQYETACERLEAAGVEPPR
jgi:hypothetical protein